MAEGYTVCPACGTGSMGFNTCPICAHEQSLTIEGWLPEQLANGQHGHWRTRQRKLSVAQQTVWASAVQAGWQPVTGKARLEITLVFPLRRTRDTDNLYSRVKGVVDGLKPFLVDDSVEWLDLHVQAAVEHGRRATVLRLLGPREG